MQAQTAKEVLDKTSLSIKKAGAMEVHFTATTFQGKTQEQSMTGVLYLKGKKFHLVSGNMMNWYDGKTMWSMLRDQDEVNISSPSVQERKNIDPYMFTDLYKNGYTYKINDTKLRGKDCYEVTMLASSKKEIKQMILSIDKNNYQPMCIRMLDTNNRWTRITISQCKKNIKLNDSDFVFNIKDYPGKQIVDLR